MIKGLSISVEQNAEKRILRLSGSIDAQTQSSLKQEIDSLFEKMHLYLLFDFTRVNSATEEALHFLLAETEKFKKASGRLGVYGISDSVMQIIKNADLERHLCIYRTEQEALELMGN